MRTPTSARIQGMFTRPVALMIALLAAGGCSTLRATVRGYEAGPNGISRSQLELREALAHQDFRTALGFSEDDALLASMNRGVTAYYAAQYQRSAAVLDSAALIADDRVTQSVSRDALSLVTSDLALPYQPRRTERLFIPYYAMLSYAKLEQWEDAAVEARRLSALLSQYAEDRSADERDSHAMMHWLASSIFERAGESDEARVSLRLARAAVPDIADSVPPRLRSDEGEVVIVVERGFVAHRITQAINVFFGDSTRPRRGDRREGVDVSARAEHEHEGDDSGYWMAVAFPALRRSSRTVGEVSALVDGTQGADVRTHALVDDALAADERRDRVVVTARAATRAATKYAVTRLVSEKKGETAGKIANYGVSLLERADVRSWHLLPQDVTVMRVRATCGTHDISVVIDGEVVNLGRVTVTHGAATFANARMWGNAQDSYSTRRP